MRVSKKIIENRLISEKISLIEKFCGLSLKPCDYFTGVRSIAGRKYFNCILRERCCIHSSELQTLERLVQKGVISHVEPNGLNRVAVFF